MHLIIKPVLNVHSNKLKYQDHHALNLLVDFQRELPLTTYSLENFLVRGGVFFFRQITEYSKLLLMEYCKSQFYQAIILITWRYNLDFQRTLLIDRFVCEDSPKRCSVLRVHYF